MAEQVKIFWINLAVGILGLIVSVFIGYHEVQEG